MKLKAIIIIAALSTTFVHTSEISIKNAEQKDIPALIALNKEVMDEYFKSAVITGYPDSPIAQNPELLNDFLNQFTNRYEPIFHNITNENNNDYHVLIASNKKDQEKILGLCIFRKEEKNSLYIQYIIVSQQSRGKGIGKALLDNALSFHDDITSCTLKTFAHGNDATRAFYEKYGFIKKELCTLDERMPNGDIIYELNLKK